MRLNLTQEAEERAGVEREIAREAHEQRMLRYDSLMEESREKKRQSKLMRDAARAVMTQGHDPPTELAVAESTFLREQSLLLRTQSDELFERAILARDGL